MGNITSLHDRRKQRNRASLKKKSKGMLRLSVFRSSKHIYGQIIDDEKGQTITSASSLDNKIKSGDIKESELLEEASELMNKMKNDIVDLDEELSQGKTTQCLNWLNNKIYKFGSLYQPVVLITLACGKEPSEVELLDYLDKKYEELYNL